MRVLLSTSGIDPQTFQRFSEDPAAAFGVVAALESDTHFCLLVVLRDKSSESAS